MMCSKAAQVLTLWYGRPSLIARNDDRLGDAGQRIFLSQGRCRSKEGAHAGHHIVLEPTLLPRIHLLLNGAVDRRIARMQANGHLARGLRLRDHFDYFIERHMRRVMNLSPVLAHIEKGRIDERSCIDDDIRLSKSSVRPLP